MLDLALSIGLVEQAGSWIKFPNGEKTQGKEKGRTYLVENPDIFKDLWKQCNEMIGL